LKCVFKKGGKEGGGKRWGKEMEKEERGYG